MSPLHLMVDAEALVVAFLAGQADVAALVGSRISTELPPAPTFPLVRLERIGGLTGTPAHLDRARIQVEAWGATKGEAHTVAATVRAALFEELPGTHPLGVVTGAEEDLGLTWSPDPESDQPRYVFGVAAFIHPAPT